MPVEKNEGWDELPRAALSGCARSPLVPSLAGALLLLAAAGLTPFTGLAAGTLVAAGLLQSHWMRRLHRASLDAARRDSEHEIRRLANLCIACAQVWARQLDTVRTEADAEVGRLARAFGEINGKLDKAIGPSHFGGGGNSQQIVAAMEDNGRELARLVAALQLLQTSKQRIVEEIGAEAARLKENAAEIRQIALHSRTVSLNATIEAARAGQAGKPFAVIVTDMRELAMRTAEASELFSRHTDRLRAMVEAAFHEQAVAEQKVVSIAGAEELVNRVVANSEATMARLTREIAAMEQERNDVRGEVSQVLVSLQFQDRVSQILSHVTTNLKDWQAHVADGRREPLDDRAWLGQLARDYSTHEEFRNHGGHTGNVVHGGAEVTYF